jgi:GH25 family lysozyme M1 (1,4-beta-N-acetylmuramidase)
MLINNYIDACAIYKKNLWQQVGGYDIKMPYQGIEDWDLWLSFGAINVKFHHLKQITFKYYVHKNSMIRSFSDKMFKENHDYVLQKHNKIIFNRFVDNTINLQKLKKNPFLAFYFYLKSFLILK